MIVRHGGKPAGSNSKNLIDLPSYEEVATLGDVLGYWTRNQISGSALDESPNNLDFPSSPGGRYLHPKIKSPQLLRGNVAGFSTIASALARIVGDIWIGMWLLSTSTSGDSGIFCYDTGLTDCIWGAGLSGGSLAVWDKSYATSARILYDTGKTQALYLPFSIPFLAQFVRRDRVWEIYKGDKIAGAILGSVPGSPPVSNGKEVLSLGSNANLHMNGPIFVVREAPTQAKITAAAKMFGGA